MTAPGIVACELLGLGDGALHALRARRQHQFGAEKRQHLAALDRHGLRHGRGSARSLGGGDEGERDAGVAGGRLDQRRRPGLSLPSRSSASIIATPMRSLTLAIGLKNSSFARRLALTPSRRRAVVEAHDRRVADRLRDVLEYAPASGPLRAHARFFCRHLRHPHPFLKPESPRRARRSSSRRPPCRPLIARHGGSRDFSLRRSRFISVRRPRRRCGRGEPLFRSN